MSKRTVIVSDIGGAEIADPKDAATITIEFADKRRGLYRLDATYDEAQELAGKGLKLR